MGNVVIIANERKTGSRTYYKMQFKARGFSQNAIFYKLNKQLPSGKYVPIYESETSMLTGGKLHEFKVAQIYSTDIVNDNENQEAMIEIFKWY